MASACCFSTELGRCCCNCEDLNPTLERRSALRDSLSAIRQKSRPFLKNELIPALCVQPVNGKPRPAKFVCLMSLGTREITDALNELDATTAKTAICTQRHSPLARIIKVGAVRIEASSSGWLACKALWRTHARIYCDGHHVVVIPPPGRNGAISLASALSQPTVVTAYSQQCS